MHEIMMDDINMLEETGSVSDFARQLSQVLVLSCILQLITLNCEFYTKLNLHG